MFNCLTHFLAWFDLRQQPTKKRVTDAISWPYLQLELV